MSKTLIKKFSLTDVEILSEKQLYSGFLELKRLKIKCRLYQGGWSEAFTRELMLRTPAVGVLIYDPKIDKLLMIEQLRIGCLEDEQNGPWPLELIAGLIKDGEDSADVARREAKEEAGIKLDQLTPICEYFNSPGASSEKTSLYCAPTDLSKVEEGIFGLECEHENIRSVVIDRTIAEDAINNGQINNAMSIIAIQWLALNLQSLSAD